MGEWTDDMRLAAMVGKALLLEKGRGFIIEVSGAIADAQERTEQIEAAIERQYDAGQAMGLLLATPWELDVGPLTLPSGRQFVVINRDDPGE